MSTPTPALDPSELLLGLTLPNTGWKIVQQISQAGSTGGTFGTAYIAEKGTQKAFVKAIDFVAALTSPTPVQRMAVLTQLAQFEEDVHRFCTDKGMSRVIGFVGKDEITPPVFGTDPFRRVFCLILEQGEEDLNKKLKTIASPALSWKLTVMSNMAQAVSQLHKEDLAHQDIRPSNVISMGSKNSDPNIKLGDLGRVVRKAGGPYNAASWPGAKQYMPPERMYGHRPSDWNDEREAADAFMVGSLLVFLFTGATMLSLLVDLLPATLRPGIWTGGYDSTIRAALINAQAQIIDTQLRPALPDSLRESICNIALELTHPEPEKRGDRRARQIFGRPVGMDRMHQRFQLLATKAKLIK